MKGILEFNLEDRFERVSFNRSVNADKTIYFINEIGKLLRNYREYGIPEEIKTPEDLTELLEQQFYDKMSECNVNTEE